MSFSNRLKPILKTIILSAVAFLLVLPLAFAGWSEQSLTNQEFAQLIQVLSERGGAFESDNFISNETSYLHVRDRLERLHLEGGVYVGVGPDQNFTYIAQTRPELAFIVDIRRQNMIQHLLYKALFHLASSRAEYLSLLFGKPLNQGPPLRPNPSIVELVVHFNQGRGDERYYRTTLARIKDFLTKGYPLQLTRQDLKELEHQYRAFATNQLDIRYQWNLDDVSSMRFPTFRRWLLETDLQGRFGNFLNSDDDFAYLQKLHRQNRIIPVVGDFAGVKALKGIAQYIRSLGSHLAVFYLSNVEEYLMEDRQLFKQYVANLRHFPAIENTVLIRTFFNGEVSHPAQRGSHVSTTLVQPLHHFLERYDEGLYSNFEPTWQAAQNYWTLVTADYLGKQTAPQIEVPNFLLNQELFEQVP